MLETGSFTCRVKHSPRKLSSLRRFRGLPASNFEASTSWCSRVFRPNALRNDEVDSGEMRPFSMVNMTLYQ